LTEEVIQVWSAILHQLPSSRLIAKSRWFDDDSTRNRYWELFSNQGIDTTRIILTGTILDHHDHLAYHSNIDLALDSFPYNGTTTTCEALIMGVPTLTLTGVTHAHRVGHSLLSSVGLSEWVATTTSEYIEKAVSFAQNWTQLAQLRSQLRQQVLNSSLCDAVTYTRQLETIYGELLNLEL